ncbi:MAG: hypothetical protein HY951_15375 [Bacteroidia bacterium]|nr:hypothetical protein [Bacteroidia bacterium]
MKNLLKLHEVVVLLNQPDKTATFQTIADEVEKRNLFPNRKGGITLAKQIKLRTAIKSSKYKQLFEYIKPDTIKLK